jgi:hypothetical protein
VAWPFYARKLLSAPEQALYFRLQQAWSDHIVLAQVQLSRLIGIRKGHDYMVWLNRIICMSADSAVCPKDVSTYAPRNQAMATGALRIIEVAPRPSRWSRTGTRSPSH